MEKEMKLLRMISKRKSENDETILHIACKQGRIEQVQYILLEFGADKYYLDQTDSNGETALHVAVCLGRLDVIIMLIQAAARCWPTTSDEYDDDDNDEEHNTINCFKDFIRHPNGLHNTALHLAVSKGKIDIAKMLVEVDPSDRHIQNYEGETPMYLAAKFGYNNIVKMMCQVCKSPSLDGPKGTTALHAVIKKLPAGAKKEDKDVVKVLIDAARYWFSESHFEAFIRQADIENMESALYLAVEGKHSDVVTLILDADPTYPHEDKNKDYKLPIYRAAEMGYTDIFFQLWRTNNCEYATLGPGDRTLLHAAILGRNTDCVRALLDKASMLVTYADDKGWTPLHMAAHSKYDTILDHIIETQRLVSRYIQSGDQNVPAPLLLAAKGGHISTVMELMLLLPPSSCVVDDDGQNILHIAAGNRDKKMIRCILTYFPREYFSRVLNQKDSNGNTPLHRLIQEGCFVPELICHKEVDIMTRNHDNWTPLDMLYLSDEIVGDQLQIRRAVVTQADKKWKSWTRYNLFSKPLSEIQIHQIWKSQLRSTRVKSDSQESVVPPGKIKKKDMDFNYVEKKWMKLQLERQRERINTQVIVTVLITTVAFTVGFTLPGGYGQSGGPGEGLVVLSKKAAFNVFMVADALALVLSTSSLFIFFIINFMFQDPLKVSKLNALSTGLNIASIIAMMITFMMGTFVVLSHSPALAVAVCVIISFFFLFVIVLSVQMIFGSGGQQWEETDEVV